MEVEEDRDVKATENAAGKTRLAGKWEPLYVSADLLERRDNDDSADGLLRLRLNNEFGTWSAGSAMMRILV